MSNVLLDSLKEYYLIKENKIKLVEILNNSNNISLRIIDWFVTNYSKKYNTLYFTDDKKNIITENLEEYKDLKQFNVYYSYKTQLKSYSKKKFDPFCRRDRIEFNIGNDKIISTLGQLNFFKWALENKIIDYIKINLKSIEVDMYVSCKKNKAKNTNGERKKRQELSVSATRTINKKNIKICVSFD